MTNYDDHDGEEPKERAPLQADIYGVKFPIVAAPTADAADRLTIRTVLDDVWQSTLRGVRDFFGLGADALTGSRSLVRGVAALPAAMNTRISGAHKLAEIREARAEQQSLLTKDESVEALLCELDRVALGGVKPKVTRLPSGQIVIAMLRPELEEIIEELAQSVVDDQLSVPPADKVQLEWERYESMHVADALGDHLARTKSPYSTDVLSTFAKHGIQTLRDLVSKDANELSGIGISNTLISVISRRLQDFGMRLRPLAFQTPADQKLWDELARATEGDLRGQIYVNGVYAPSPVELLRNAGINTLGELAAKTADDLEKLDISDDDIRKIDLVLSRLGAALRQDQASTAVTGQGAVTFPAMVASGQGTFTPPMSPEPRDATDDIGKRVKGVSALRPVMTMLRNSGSAPRQIDELKRRVRELIDPDLLPEDDAELGKWMNQALDDSTRMILF